MPVVLVKVRHGDSLAQQPDIAIAELGRNRSQTLPPGCIRFDFLRRYVVDRNREDVDGLIASYSSVGHFAGVCVVEDRAEIDRRQHSCRVVVSRAQVECHSAAGILLPVARDRSPLWQAQRAKIIEIQDSLTAAAHGELDGAPPGIVPVVCRSRQCEALPEVLHPVVIHVGHQSRFRQPLAPARRCARMPDRCPVSSAQSAHLWTTRRDACGAMILGNIRRRLARMSGLCFELAGLATAAVPDLRISGAAEWTTDSGGNYDSAVVRTEDGVTLLVRRAVTEDAENELVARSRALAVMTQGIRARLAFAVPHEFGVLRDRAGSVGVYGFIPGTTLDRVQLDFDSMIVPDLGRALAAIHALPRQFVAAAGLPERTASQSRQQVEQLLDRADTTNRLPAALADRWGAAIDDPQLWDFVPSVIHGSLERYSFVTNGAGITGVLGWSDLQIGDPALDMRWIHTLDGAVVRALLDEYTDARGASVDRQIRQRSLLYAELELARWLIHGVTTQDPAIIADAEQLLDGLVTRVRALDESTIRHETLPVLDLEQVQALLADAGTRARTGLPSRPMHSDMEAPEDLGDDLTDAERAAINAAADASDADENDASDTELSASDAERVDDATASFDPLGDRN